MEENSSPNDDEKNYLRQVERIIENGDRIDDRTGVGTLSLFGLHSSYSLRNGLFIFICIIFRFSFYLLL